MERRDRSPAAAWWETEAGRAWLSRLVVATLGVCGLKRGVGAETRSECCGRLRLEAPVGGSPSPLRWVRHTVECLRVTTAGAWETAGMAHGAIRPVIGAVDAPFLQRMLLGLMDLAPGSWLLAEVSADRRCAACVDRATKRLTPLGTAGVSLVRDRAQALITLAHTGLGGPSSPALLPLGHDLAKGYALGLFGRLRHAKRPLDHAKQRLEKWQQNSQAERGAIEPAQALGAAWAPSVHPWRLADSRRQTSQEVAEQGRAALEAMATWLAPKGLPMPKAIVAKVRTHLTGIAALVDWWGPTVRHALTHLAMTPRWTQGAAAGLLPLLS
jgi:hypothetical protein